MPSSLPECFPSPQASQSRMSGIQLMALGCVSSQGEDSPPESLAESQEKQDSLTQIAPDLTVIQFIKGKGGYREVGPERHVGPSRTQPLPALLDFSFTPTDPS